MASSSRRLRAALPVFAVLAAVFLAGAGVAGAARPLPTSGGGVGGGEEAAAGAAYLVVDPAAAAVAVVKARETVEMLMARLPAGPSPRGGGH